MKERRSGFRYPLVLPVMVSAIPPLKGVEPRLGWTRNISARGVYFDFQRRLAVGTKFKVSILFPKISINGRATVVRTEGKKKNHGKKVRIAARIEQPEIVRGESKAKSARLHRPA
jgi:hypothetical protein